MDCHAIHNVGIATVFEKIADLLEIKAANPFRVRAYQNAARILGELGRCVKGRLETGEKLADLQRIGDDLARKVLKIVRTGSRALLSKPEGEIPPAVTGLLKVPRPGPKRGSARRAAAGWRRAMS